MMLVRTSLLLCAAGLVAAIASASGARHARLSAQERPQGVDASRDYDAQARTLTPDQRRGRDTWIFWTGGNERFWRQLTRSTAGTVDLLLYLDSRLHDRRFERLGVINHPACRAAVAPDRFGLWLDDCGDAEPVERMPGRPSGIVGLRLFDNPAFDAGAWRLQAYLQDRRAVEPPFLVGMSCGFCHVGFNPLDPPPDPNRAAWANLHPTIGNQYFEEGKLFSLNLTAADFRWHVANRQPPGTSDTSRLVADHIDNPSAINAIFDLGVRPTAAEQMRDGTTRRVPHFLKDGADSVGLPEAAMRVYVNIGVCGEYAATLHDPIDGTRRPQRPFDPEHARSTCEAWRQTEARLPALAAFLETLTPLRLANAPGGAAYLRADPDVLRRGKIVFADTCAPCHSSKRPPDGVSPGPWFRASVLADDFLVGNFLSDDARKPASRIGTNLARAVATNATRGHLWDRFSSETYKALPSAGVVRGLYNPVDPTRPLTIRLPEGGRGYYRTPSLASVWATAPYLHNNSVGVFVKDPSVPGRMAAYLDGMEKLLWPEKRLGPQSIPVTTVDSTLAIGGAALTLRVPGGTPIDLLARADPGVVARLAATGRSLKLAPGNVILSGLLRGSLVPDFVLDRGHAFGASLPDADKWALIEFLKTF